MHIQDLVTVCFSMSIAPSLINHVSISFFSVWLTFGSICDSSLHLHSLRGLQPISFWFPLLRTCCRWWYRGSVLSTVSYTVTTAILLWKDSQSPFKSQLIDMYFLYVSHLYIMHHFAYPNHNFPTNPFRPSKPVIMGIHEITDVEVTCIFIFIYSMVLCHVKSNSMAHYIKKCSYGSTCSFAKYLEPVRKKPASYNLKDSSEFAPKLDIECLWQICGIFWYPFNFYKDSFERNHLCRYHDIYPLPVNSNSIYSCVPSEYNFGSETWCTTKSIKFLWCALWAQSQLTYFLEALNS